ncbi:uncharacterized protein LOC113136890 [Mastacembelus armatus]|uniref:uncharacterized protein LOC113136890 n=1 Tax=Mastacembelus armatus TaxID=205130 RepID=UPI000E46362E|nr:uncharacterized protein LOC113136890 [Mastacembelus armatus]
MAQYITHIDVSLNQSEEQKLQSKGFKKINVDLNKGAGGNFIYMWYKSQAGTAPITRIQLTFSDDMGAGLSRVGYTRIFKDLNAGAGGDYIYLWYFRGPTEFDFPIVDIDVTTDATQEAQKFVSGWEKVACDLNRKAEGSWIHAWVKRESNTYISDVIVTLNFGSDGDYFQKGYIRLDEDVNRGAEGPFVFIWYRLTTNPQQALTDLQISTNSSEYQALQQRYKSLSVDLNEGTGGNRVYLWYRKDPSEKPIKAITLLVNTAAPPVYESFGANVIKGNLNAGTKGSTEYLCFYQ